MAALLDHADSDWLLRHHALAQQRIAVCLQENIRFQKSRSRCSSRAELESTGDRVPAAPDGLSQTWSDKLRAGRQSLCGGEAASSRNAEQRVTPSEEEGEASSDALCEGGVSGDSSRTLRGTAAVKRRLEIDSGVFSNTERTCYQSTTCSAEGAETTLLVGLNTCRTAVKKAKQPNP